MRLNRRINALFFDTENVVLSSITFNLFKNNHFCSIYPTFPNRIPICSVAQKCRESRIKLNNSDHCGKVKALCVKPYCRYYI